MSHEFLDTDQLPIPAPEAGLGEWENVRVPDDGDERKAAILGVGLEACAQRTTWLRHRRDRVVHGEMTIPSLTTNGATVTTATPFVVTKALTINTSVPTGTGGHSAPVIWTTPTIPYVIEGCFIKLTGPATSSVANPGLTKLTMFLGPHKLIEPTLSSFSAGVMQINGSTLNRSVLGCDSADWGPLLDGTLSNSGRDLTGAASIPGKFLAYANISGTEFFGKSVFVNLAHSWGSAVTIAMPMLVTIYGRLL